MLLLSGPPGSGLTSHILAELRQAFQRRASNVLLLVPTATMAEHLRHELAREGFVLRPGLILTLSRFIAPWVEDLPEVSGPTLYLLVEAAARRLSAPEFERVLGTPGFCATLAQAIQEFAAAGCDSQQLQRALPYTQFGRAFSAVYREVEGELARRGLGFRSARLERAAQRVAREGLRGIDTVWLDGFFALTDPELALARAIGRRADLTVTLPDSGGANPTRDALLSTGFEEQRVAAARAEPVTRAFSAKTADREAAVIARRILDELEAGVEFREIGIVVRNPEIYLAPLKAALDRFGVPARFYFPEMLGDIGVVRYLSGLTSALLSGWDWSTTLAALRFSGDSPALDRFDFAVREQLPGHGIDGLRALAKDAWLGSTLDALAEIDSWRSDTLAPSRWAARLAALRKLAPRPMPADHVSHEVATMWRSQAAALAAFETALGEAANFVGDGGKVALAEFWIVAEAVLRLTPLRVPDHRRNVVHVLSASEARQWDLPVVFICGLADQQFPKRHAQEPLFPDAVRMRLAGAGIRLRTAAELDAQERALFDLAAGRATRRLTLSYAETDARGVGLRPSQFLRGAVEPSTQIARPIPAPFTPDTATAIGGDLHRSFSVSGLECFLGCPFQFFARYTLKLRDRPLLPQERLDFMLQGTIVHQVLAEWHLDPKQPIEPLFERIFAQKCDEKAVFDGYRTELLRRQMLDDLRRFSEKTSKLPVSGEVLTEQQFEMTLPGDLRLRGRIDRIDKLPDGRALIVDYKYSAAQRVAGKMDQETLLQGGLYALAVERELGLRPAAMFYYGIKKDLKIVGWSDPPGAFGIDSEPLTREWIDGAVTRARAAVGEIRDGRIAPDPVDLELCRLCDYRDVCRYNGAARALGVEARRV